MNTLPDGGLRERRVVPKGLFKISANGTLPIYQAWIDAQTAHTEKYLFRCLSVLKERVYGIKFPSKVAVHFAWITVTSLGLPVAPDTVESIQYALICWCSL
jgi:hypothetical protein